MKSGHPTCAVELFKWEIKKQCMKNEPIFLESDCPQEGWTLI